MSNLKPGATYIYESADGITYARELGTDPATRIEIGYNYDPRTRDGRPLVDHIRDDQLWGKIRRAAETNSVLKEELDRVITFYLLSEENV